MNKLGRLKNDKMFFLFTIRVGLANLLLCRALYIDKTRWLICSKWVLLKNCIDSYLKTDNVRFLKWHSRHTFFKHLNLKLHFRLTRHFMNQPSLLWYVSSRFDSSSNFLVKYEYKMKWKRPAATQWSHLSKNAQK